MAIRGVRFTFAVKVQIDIDRANLASLREAEQKATDRLKQLEHLTDEQIELIDWVLVEGPAKEAR